MDEKRGVFFPSFKHEKIWTEEKKAFVKFKNFNT